jgi:Icc-related predicted phosphoesterase
LRTLLTLILCLAGLTVALAANDSLSVPRNLRGYGAVSATVSTEGPVRVLRIRCESREKAALLQSKFLSDLDATGPSRQRERVAAFVEDSSAVILTGPNTATLATYARAHRLEASTPVAVPMYLDAWDQHGFRFYYRPWEKPKGAGVYDPSGEFEFAKKLGGLGFVFWAKGEGMDFTYGQSNTRWWDWAERLASRRNLPMVINTANSDLPWLANYFREQTAMKMPQYCGSYHSVASPYLGGTGFNSWAATDAKDVQLSVLQQYVKKYSDFSNTLEYLEPHGEPFHGKYSLFLEYGPETDKSFRRYLKEQYGTVEKVAARWGKGNLRDWDQVHLPELASFLGWGPEALDLTGTWRVNYPRLKKKISNFNAYRRKIIPVEPAPEAWYGTQLDDSGWGTLTAPGHDEQMFLEQRPAVMRRHFSVPAEYLKKHPKLWLYVWDLNFGHRDTVKAVVNGQLAGTDQIPFNTPHWAAFEVGQFLEPGKNLLAIRLPKGYIGYRAYLSPDAPKQYPALGEHKNAQWVDFIDWRMWVTTNAVEKGISMIRQVDKDRSIICMAPDSYAENIRELCIKYGAHFRNTGYMGGVWAEYLPMLMRGANLPMSVEPGGPASDLPGFKRMMGFYFTSGVNAINYFIHVGSIMWNDPIREHFEKIQPMVNMFGKMHQPKSRVAVLFNSRGERLVDYPWKADYNTMMPQGYWSCRLNEALYGYYNVDGLMPGDFENGLADPYKVIIDDNNMIMSSKQIDDMADWVKKGGIFVTFGQSGRHTPEKMDAWPIAKLTGYQVVGKHVYKNDKPESSRLSYAPGQTFFDSQFLRSLGNRSANGIMLKKVKPECQDLLKWADGSTAVGLRPLGKGYVVNIGAKFVETTLRWQDNRTRMLLEAVLKRAKIQANAASASKVRMSHYLTNNGLQDVWVLWNPNGKKDITTELKFRAGAAPELTDITSGQKVAAQVTLKPYQTLMLTSDAHDIASAGVNWFNLQRGWWSGTQTPPAFKAVETNLDMSLPLNDGWKLLELKPGQTADKLVAAGIGDSSWRNTDLGVWKYPTEVKSKHLLLRRQFQAPTWGASDTINLYISAWYKHATLVAGCHMRVWLDGRPIGGNLRPNHGIAGLPLNLSPGSNHVLALEITGGDNPLVGIRGSCFLSRIPAPQESIDLRGEWQTSTDVLSTGPDVTLPGAAKTLMFRRSIDIPKHLSGKKVYLYLEGNSSLIGCTINGHFVRRHHHMVGELTYLNITPWVKCGETNRIDLVRWNGSGPASVQKVKLYFY